MTIKVAAVQMNCLLEDLHANLAKAVSLAEDAVKRGAQWLIFPELFNTGYYLPGRDYDLAEHIPDGYTTQWMIKLAQKHDVLITGCIMERGETDGIVFDTELSVSKDGLLGRYRKINLWGDECLRFSKGRGYCEPLTWGDWKIGMQICYEVGFPEGARMNVLKGANVLVYSAAFGKARYYAWDIATRARALENGCYLIAAGRSGEEHNKLFFLGHSRIVAPDGSVLAEAIEEDEVILADLDTEIVVQQRRALPYLRDINIPIIKAAWQSS